MHPSYFIGIALPVPIAEAITTIQSEVNPETTLIAPLQPHITVMHPDALSAVSPLYFEPITKEVAADFLPLQIELKDFGIFNNSTLYIAAESVALCALQTALVARLPKHVQAEYFIGKTYKPHITLAQVRGKTLEPEVIEAYKQKLAYLLPTTFEVQALTKYSRLAPRQYKTKTI